VENIAFPSRDEIAPTIVSEIIQLIEQSLGVDIRKIWIDPGFGFGKKGDENLEVLNTIPALVEKTRRPIVVGVSRKHFVEGIYSKYDCSMPIAENTKLNASLRLAIATYERGAEIFRVHDVLETCMAFQNILQSRHK